MGIYFGCHCFNMTNGHASSCVAQFIYADIIRSLKWNIQWTTCQKFNVYLTWPLLQTCYSYVLCRIKANCKLDEYSGFGGIITWLGEEVTWYSGWNTSSPICKTSRRGLKVGKKSFWLQTSEEQLPKVVSWTERDFHGLKSMGSQWVVSGEKL